jgi:hypothetical protein
LCDWLLRGLIDFDYICESTLSGYCNIDDINAQGFPVGKMKYEVVIVPSMETIRRTTLERLEAFRKAGGRIIFLGESPKYVDAVLNNDAIKLCGNSEKIGFERLRLLDTLKDIREIDIRDSTGALANNLLYQLREELDDHSNESAGQGSSTRWLFIAHADNPKNPDLPGGDLIRIRVRGEWAATLYNTINGEICPLPVNQLDGWTCIVQPFYDHDSLLIRLDKSEPVITGEDPGLVNIIKHAAYESPGVRFFGTVPVTLEEPNVLLLDMAEYSLDSGHWRCCEEILRLDNILRTELKWPNRCDSIAQPWVENDTTKPHTLRLRCTFESEIPLSGAELALENAVSATVTLNGEKTGQVNGWYVDKCIGRISLPEIKAGINVLEVSIPYGRKVDIEAMYLLGDFGVNVSGTFCVITKPVRVLSFSDITRQGLPFYGGNIIYHLEAETPTDDLTIRVTNYRGHLLKINVDGKDYGPLVYSPYEMVISRVGKGRHKIDLVWFGSRINTFGQLHCVERDPSYWWGPNSWRTTGANWSYEYRYWSQGVLKSPEIF